MRNLAIFAFTLLSTTACSRTYDLPDAPQGFAEVSENGYSAHFKAGDGVGLKIDSFANTKGGSLDFWSADLTKKLDQRGYRLESKGEIESANGVGGRRFNFSYGAPQSDGTPSGVKAGESEKFYTVLLFVNDNSRVVVQAAGDIGLRENYEPALREVTQDLNVRRCRFCY